MNTTREIEKAIVALPPAELKEFRAWFAEYDAKSWDSQIEQDAKSGKLSELANQALKQHGKGETKEI